ncbi:MAG: A/G-specific adenine glycosylase [Gloeomargarita sp. HHBFW_bins_162]
MNTQWFRTQLLAWYAQYGRDLPWRKTHDPYAILVSEFMLQQTQVTTVIPYYQTWLQTLPTIQHCAEAKLPDIFKLWEGLGYYRRAEYLHQTCQIIQRDYAGTIPQELDVLITFPGIGRTTAGGILSHAFNVPVPILDGNVKRVLSRLFALTTPPNRNTKQLWDYSEQLLSPDEPRLFNQALMDVGAIICLPKVPRCERCPWQNGCISHQTHQTHLLPMSEPSKDIPHRLIGVGVIWNPQGQILIDQRPKTGLLANLWEFPGGKVEPGESIPDCIRREIYEELGIEIYVQEHLVTVNHRYSHLQVTLVVHHCQYKSGTPELRGCQAYAWVGLADLSNYPFPKANQKIIRALQTSSPPSWLSK